MPRRTKIVATLGPATDRPEVLAALLGAGVDVVRLNFSHGDPDSHRERAARVRAVAEEQQRPVAILGDLQGPKIRIESFAGGAVDLVEGRAFALDAALPADAGDDEVVGVAYPDLPRDVAPGAELLLDDGAIELVVERVTGTRIDCRVRTGGRLSDRKGLNLRGGGLSAGGLGDKDAADIRLAAELEVDFLAVSFPRSAADLEEARGLLHAAGGRARLVAKIERAEAVADLEAVIGAADAVMVARGDLGVEIGDAELPAVQKRIISQAREMNRPVITATQMMESMVDSPRPTRAEVLDVANAVLDGTDAVMLSAESAVGAYPVQAVAAMARICAGAEREQAAPRSAAHVETHFRRTDEAIAMATVYTATHMHADAIVALTDSGTTALLMSRQDVPVPIYALTAYPETRRFLALCRGVYPVDFEPSAIEGPTPIREAITRLRDMGAVREGQRVLVTKGDFTGPGGTNAMKIVTV